MKAQTPALTALLAVLLLSGCTLATKFDPAVPEAMGNGEFSDLSGQDAIKPEWLRPPHRDYTLGAGDRLEIEILAEENSRATAFVTPDGKIYYNLLPGIEAKGKTINQLKREMEAQLATLYRHPQTSITLLTADSQRVWVLGRVNKPGNVALRQPTRLLDALSLAGGLYTSSTNGTSQELADLSHSFIKRSGTLLPVNFEKLIRTGDMTHNIYLEPNDFIYLPSSLNNEVYVMGGVNVPRSVPFSNDMNIVGAIGSVGGAMAQADTDHVTIIRGSLTQPKYAVVNLRKIMHGGAPNVRLQPGDIINVPMPGQFSLSNYAMMAVNTYTQTIAGREGSSLLTKDGNPGTTTVIGTNGQIQTVTPLNNSSTSSSSTTPATTTTTTPATSSTVPQ